jgi:hypothetical protein
VVAHAARGGDKHTPELPAAEQPESSAGQDHFFCGLESFIALA